MAKPPANITPKSVAQPLLAVPQPHPDAGLVAGFDFLEVRTLVEAPDF
jgi:hypothetical protein